MKRTVKWSELGKPKAPGKVLLQGLGCVDVSQERLDAARRCGGDPVFVLQHVPPEQTRCDYRLGGIRTGPTAQENFVDNPPAAADYGASRYPSHA